MFTMSYREQRQVQEKLQAEADRERTLKTLPQENARKAGRLWKLIISSVI